MASSVRNHVGTSLCAWLIVMVRLLVLTQLSYPRRGPDKVCTRNPNNRFEEPAGLKGVPSGFERGARCSRAIRLTDSGRLVRRNRVRVRVSS